MGAKVKFSCQKCGAPMPDEPAYTEERDESGNPRVVRVFPSKCGACRDKTFWHSWDRKVRRDG